jgi:7-cyano-7-deazaguanine synthase
MRDAIALLSAGLDSTVAVALALESGMRVAAFTVDYGQRAAPAELRQSERLARHFGIPHRSEKLDLYRKLPGGGALLDHQAELPRPDRKTLDAGGKEVERSARKVWVPNRNGLLVHLAAAVAESEGRDCVIVGFNREEAATFPDNSRDFLAAVNRSLEYSTQNRVQLIAPTLDFDKLQILKEALRLQVPLEELWPCYDSQPTWCGTCESCARLRRALTHSGLDFPTNQKRD